MLNRGNLLLALGVFGAVFCVTFWRDSLFQGWGLAIENAPESARVYKPLSTTVDVKFQKAKETVIEDPDAPTPSKPATPDPKDTRFASITREDGGHRLCQETDEGQYGRYLSIVDYDDTRFHQREGLKFTWRASGCEEAIRTRGEAITGLQARKRIAAVIPRTDAYSEELRTHMGVIQMIEDPNGGPPPPIS